MSTVVDPDQTPPAKASKLPLVVGFVLAVLGGGGGFYAVQTGLIGGSEAASEETELATDVPPESKPAASFVAIDPLVISLPSTQGRDHLRFAAQLEVAPKYMAEVEAIKPRLVDVLNGYLRAVALSELEDPTALIRLRAQMLRRLQVVAGEGRISDLLIMEFVLS